MERDFDKMLQDLVYGYRTTCSEDAKLLEEAVQAGDAVLLYRTLFEKANLPTLSTNEKLFHSVRFFYFVGYCMNYNNGIPMFEVLSDWIDNDEKRKVINAVKSQANLFEYLIEHGANIKILADYIEEREMIEYAIDEEKKSTGVLKRILKRKRSSLNNSILQTPSPILDKQTLSVPDWCIVFYFVDEAGTQEGNKIDRMEKFIEDNNVLSPSGKLTTKGNFKKEYHEIENRINGKNDKNPLPPKRIKNILPYLKNNKKALKAAKSDIEHLTNEIEENKRNTY